MTYEQFKKETLDADKVITRANDMRAVSDEYKRGFLAAMWEAREIYQRLEELTEEAEEA